MKLLLSILSLSALTAFGQGAATINISGAFTGISNQQSGVYLPSLTTSGATSTNVTTWNSTNIGPIWNFGDANKTNGAYISPTGEVLSNAVGSVTIAGGSVTATGQYNGNAAGLTNLFQFPRIWDWEPTGSGVNLSSVGDAASFAAAGVKIDAVTNTHVAIRYFATNISLSSNFMYGASEIPLKTGIFTYNFAVTNATNLRVWIGLSATSGTTMSQQTVAGTARNGCWLYCDTTNDTHWEVVGGDAVAFEQYTNAAVSVTANTPIQAQLVMTASGGAVSSVAGYINGTLIGTISTRVPKAVLMSQMVITTTTTQVNALDFYGFYGAQGW